MGPAAWPMLATVPNGRTHASVRASTLEMQAAFILAGGGVGMLPDFAVEGLDGLVEADPATLPLVREIWLVVHTDMRHAPAIRAVMDCLGRSVGPLGR